MVYSLTDEDRIEIYAMKQAGKKQNIIAASLGVAASTISRELKRNAGLRGYRHTSPVNTLIAKPRTLKLFRLKINNNFLAQINITLSYKSIKI